MFLENKYTKWYNEIVFRSRGRILENGTYTENHHIIPRCMGGSDQKKNLVALTAREHFVCHWLLTKMVIGADRYKLTSALSYFYSISPKQKRNLTSFEYAVAREAYAKRSDNLRWYTNGIEQRMIGECPDGWYLGMLPKKVTTKGRKYWNKDGNEVTSADCPGEGWALGRVNKGCMPWVKDGVMLRQADCPGPGWVVSGPTKDRLIWNKDGKVKRTDQCPGEGWLLGDIQAGISRGPQTADHIKKRHAWRGKEINLR